MDSARWSGFRFRDGDVVITTPPKCGTTWTQHLCAMLVLDTTELPGPLAELSPWLDMLTSPLDEVVALLEAQEHRRVIKTHTPLDGLPLDDRVTYVAVGRDPRDVSLSWANHRANIDLDALMAARMAAVGLDDLTSLGPMPPEPPEDPVERFWQWAEAEDGGFQGPPLVAIVDQLLQAWRARHERNVSLFHYTDLERDLPAQVRRLADVLGITVAEERVAAVAAAASFERMRERADVLAPDVGHRIWRSNGAFFHRGASGQWRELLDADGLKRYDERVRALSDDVDFTTWLHGGWSAAPAPGRSMAGAQEAGP
jgi:hypothetical protein